MEEKKEIFQKTSFSMTRSQSLRKVNSYTPSAILRAQGTTRLSSAVDGL